MKKNLFTEYSFEAFFYSSPHSALYYPLPHFVSSQEMFQNVVTSPLLYQLDLGGVTLSAE